MDHDIRTERGVTIVALTGDVDVAQGLGLRDLLGELLSGPPGPIVIDLAGVRFLDSSGVGLFVTSHRRAGEDGRGFALAAPGDAVRRTLQLTRTDRILTIHETLDDALGALGS
ncbi:MAG TPA: STAS domain-containing protein [Acidimicrobiales bacterium]|nr:STAS domain-containing protein [Acidimicrobiales bacterium]